MKISISIPKELDVKLERLAEKEQRSKSNMITVLLNESVIQKEEVA